MNPTLKKLYKELCEPSKLYFVISIVIFLITALQNFLNPVTNVYCIGPYSCETENTSMVFVSKLLYILFWTWVLDTLCRAGYKKISWFLVMLPIILMFIGILLFIFTSSKM
tara:strand:+ start:207 stop:539 length:333 start_codon:yes stop_codon:yes gene_type:complete